MEFPSNHHSLSPPPDPNFARPRIDSTRVLKRIDKYIFGEQIGQGRFASVHIVTSDCDSKQYVMKQLPKKHYKTDPEYAEFLTQETKIMKKISHPNIITLENFYESKNNYYIAMEYCKNGDFASYMSKNSFANFPEVKAIYYLKQISLGFKELHKIRVIHRDFKLENIFLHEDDTVVIGDFGMARRQVDTMREWGGSLPYMAPEMLRNEVYTNLADLWAVGVVFYQ
jgi:serine/threonine protein kinase